MTNEEFGVELVRRLNALDDDEKEARIKMYRHHVVMSEGLQMDVDRLIHRLSGTSKRGMPRVEMQFEDDEFVRFNWRG